MGAGHTPGPWAAEPAPYGWDFFSAYGKLWVANIHRPVRPGVFGYPTTQECEANARLISAAPDLLEALRECADKLWVLRCNSRDRMDREAAEVACNMANAAIAKALGQ